MGILKFDGLTFVSIRDNDARAVTKFPVLGVLADSNDQLWATDNHAPLFSYSAGRLAGPLSVRSTQAITGSLDSRKACRAPKALSAVGRL
jgi:hypothetical protein